MKKNIMLLSIVLVIFIAITIWGVLNYYQKGEYAEGFAADSTLLNNERQKLQFEGGKRYNDLGRIQSPEANVDPGEVKKAIQQVVPVLSNTNTGTTSNNESMIKLIQTQLGLTTAENTILIPGNTSQTGVVSQKIAVCEALRVNGEEDCEVLGRPEYSECGICHKDGVDSKGKPVRGVGMFISIDDQIRANEVAESTQGTAVYKPTIGKCAPKNFTMAKNHCKHRHNQIICESAGAATLSNKCAYCFGGTSAESSGLIYVGPKLPSYDAYLNISHPGTVGVWPTITGSRDSLAAAPSYNKSMKLQPQKIRINIKENDVVSISLKGMPDVWCAWLSDSEGKRIVPIDVGMSPSSITPEESAYIAGDKRSLRVTRVVSSDPLWSSYSKLVPTNVLWYSRNLSYEPSTSVTFSFNVPATLMDPSPPMVAGTGEGSFWDIFREREETVKQCPTGPMIYTENGSAMMNANSCFKANGSFNPTLNCMQGLFLGTGGETAGKLYPTTEAAAAALAVKNSLDDTVSFLNGLANIAIYGVDENGSPVDFKTFRDASIKMLGRVPGNPCDMDKDPNNGVVNYSPECLDYLWRTVDKVPGTPEQVFADGSELANIPYLKCGLNGTMAPLKSNGSPNPAAKKYPNSVPLDTIRAEYKKIFDDAQNSSNFDGQVNNIGKCYGASLNPPGASEVFGVFPGTYTTAREDAQKVCLKYNATLATLKQLSFSQAQGADTCATGWVADDTKAYYPITTSTQGGCGNGRTGLMRWTPDSKRAGVYCFGTKPTQGTPDVASFKGNIWNNPNIQSNPILCPPLPMNPRIQKGNKIGKITGTTRNYILTFDITPLGTTGGWGSILHFTYTDKDCCSPGDRAPGIWFGPGNTRLHIRMGDTTDGNWGIDTDSLPMNVTSKVQIRCIDNNPKITVGSAETYESPESWRFWPSYDAVQPGQRPDPAGRPLIIYAGDPWYEPAKATIANLVYQIIP
jgi:hypothetical protein